MSGFRLALDTGGTFTDVVAFDERDGSVSTTKTPTTPADPSIGFMHGLAKIARQAGISLGEVVSVSHGTTVATNALLSEEGMLPGVGLIVTRGFRHLLEIARQSVPQGYGNSYFWVKPDRPVPLHLVQEVTERLNFRGEVLTPLDTQDCERVAAWFRERGINSLAVCFLHAYANGAHERVVREVIARCHPAASVSISSEVLPEYREYERAVTTIVDVFVKPRVARYVAQIRERVENEVGSNTPFFIMKSNGGVVSAREVARQPIATVLSGPAAGALGASLLAQATGRTRVLTLDGGGTSTDVAVVDDGTPHVTTEGRIGHLPVKVPMIDIATVGAGGGSVARRLPDGRLKVGPESAGADPGPMCYPRGGDQPTITDASLTLGRIPPHLLGGEIPLDAERAVYGMRCLGETLGLDAYRAAAGVLEIATWSQANAVRQVTVRRGLDVRDYSLVAFGGSGPLQAGKLVDVLGLTAALVPPNPGNLSAFGLLTVDLRHDYVKTEVQRDDTLDPARLNATFAELEHRARGDLAAERFAPEAVLIERTADLRYFGQAWEVRVSVPAGALDRALADTVVEQFHLAHQRRYGYSYRGALPPQQVEWVNLRVTGVGPIERPALKPVRPELAGGIERAQLGPRRVYFDGSFLETPIFGRARLQPADAVPGPAVIEEFGATTIVFPGMHATVDQFGNLVLERGR